MTTTIGTPKLLADIAERAVLTYAEALLGLLLATGTTNLISLSVLESVAIAAIPAGLAVIKGSVGALLGRSGTASWLPAKADPASVSTIN
ncbi:holin [Streptomyces sp. NPDC057909]|uniref:holin n=1 Tax=Streptomyces sp. NPDC057909 TaxID=3346277 RepID=UPI0036E5BBEF